MVKTLSTALPNLYTLTRTGAMQQWRVWSEAGRVWTEWGLLLGKKQQTSKACIPTNVGRSNARDADEQAAFEAGAYWRSKFDEGYSVTQELAKVTISRLPMLADKLKDPTKIHQPVDVQTKLDGVRALAYWDEGEIKLMSRGGKTYLVPHIQKALESFLPLGVILDGELYCHGLKCQKITSLVKKNKPGSENLVYMVFDVPHDGHTDKDHWTERRKYMEELFTPRPERPDPPCIKMVATVTVPNGSRIEEIHNLFVFEGYEGAMIRYHDGLYQWGERSKDLLKYKHFVTSEFKVVGIVAGEGKLEKAGVFVCKNDLTEATFNVIFAGTYEERCGFLTNAKKYIGQDLTVRYFDRTQDQLPRFPVGVVFRCEEDMP
jgi:DNA ligase-1